MSHLAQAQHLVNNLDNRLLASAYDIAWMARLPAATGHGPRWPHLIEWLLANQWPDGSWGGAIPYTHDRVLCTLVAIIALAEHPPRRQRRRAEQAIQAGEAYLWQNTHLLRHDLMELVGFELIFPTLLGEAQQLGLNVMPHFCGYGRIRDSKLRLLPLDLIYAPGTSVAFSLEFLGEQGDRERLAQVQRDNGAIACSPATTAYLLRQDLLRQEGHHNAAAWDYLERVQGLPGGAPAFSPWKTFEAVWVLEHLHFGGIQVSDVATPALWATLQAAVTPQGIGIDPAFGINDGDTTSVTLHALARGGQPVDMAVLRRFEEPEKRTFRTFDFERNASVVTNVHALETLALLPDYPERSLVWERVVTSILDHQLYQSFWIDKWHASPYYATAHVLLGLMNVKEYDLVDYSHAVEWLAHNQRPDGLWGFFDQGTAEETAYALLTLMHYYPYRQDLFTRDVIQRGAEALARAIDRTTRHPELWIAKTLYTPVDLIEAALLAAQHLYDQQFARAHA